MIFPAILMIIIGSLTHSVDAMSPHALPKKDYCAALLALKDQKTLLRHEGNIFIDQKLIIRICHEQQIENTYWQWRPSRNLLLNNSTEFTVASEFYRITLNEQAEGVELDFQGLVSQPITTPDGKIWRFHLPYNPNQFSSVQGSWLEEQL